MKFKGRWLPEKVYDKYRPSCKQLDINNFKQDKRYVGVVGNDTRNYETTINFYKYIVDNYPDLLAYLDVFLTNDAIGNPKTHIIDGQSMSCGTLRFIKVLGDIYIKHNIRPNSIVEIGCGYGGQAKIITDYVDVDYTCIDLSEACCLIGKYLEAFKKNVKIQSTDDFKSKEYDLVISDYCLSELDEGGVDTYMDSIVSKCKYAYITVNNNAPVLSHLLKRLQESFQQLEIVDEIPPTSRHYNLIIFCK